MTNQAISELPAAPSLTGNEAIPVVQSGQTRRTTPFDILTTPLSGDDTVWMDLDFPLIVRTTGPGTPALEVMVGNVTAPRWAVNDFLVCEGQELSHNWHEGSTLYWHLHLVTSGQEAVATFVAFEIELVIASIDNQATPLATLTSGDVEIAANTPDLTMRLIPIGQTDLAGYTIGAHIYARLKRVASAGAAPSADPWVTMLQAHFEIDGLGSREMATK